MSANLDYESLMERHLEGELSEEETEQLFDGLGRDPQLAMQLATKFEEAELLSHVLAGNSQALQAEASLRDPNAAAAKGARTSSARPARRFSWKPVCAAAALLAVLTLGYLGMRQRPDEGAPDKNAREEAAATKPFGLAFLEEAEGTQILVNSQAQPAVKGQQLQEGQGLQVQGHAVVTYPDGTRLAFGPGSRVKAFSESNPAGGKRVLLIQGLLTATVSKQVGAPMVFSTPVAESTVLGTKLRLAVDEQATRLEVTEGQVRLKRLSDAQSVDVAAGYFSVAEEGIPLIARAGPGLFQLPEDRKIDWTLAGIPGGIPHRTALFKTIAATLGNGTTDATAAIQSALDTCPAGQVILLPAGTYRTSQTLHLRSDTTLRGDGAGRTVIQYQGPARRSVLEIRGNNYNDISILKRIFIITAGGVKGSNRLTLNSTAGISAGDILLVDQLNDGELVDHRGSEGVCTFCSREDGSRARGQLLEVTAIKGNEVALNLPLFWSLSPTLAPQAVLISAGSMVRRAGIEKLSITQTKPVTDFILELDGAQYCWLQDVEISRMKRRGVWQSYSLQNEIRDSRMHESAAGAGRDRGYGLHVDLQSTSNLYENNLFHDLAGGIMVSGGAIGNVFGYNCIADTRYDEPRWEIQAPSISHATHPSLNLWEGNWGVQVGTGFSFGSCSHQTIFRCRFTGFQSQAATENCNAVEFQYKSTHLSVIGCVLGTAGHSSTFEVAFPDPAPYSLKPIWRLGYGGPNQAGDPNVKATLLRHGNWDAVTQQVHWDPQVPAQTLPASLYHSTKPAWWGALTWPPIGPDVPGFAAKIPAQVRLESGKQAVGISADW